MLPYLGTFIFPTHKVRANKVKFIQTDAHFKAEALSGITVSNGWITSIGRVTRNYSFCKGTSQKITHFTYPPTVPCPKKVLLVTIEHGYGWEQ